MLAPSYYRPQRQRERGISLSRTSSLQKLNEFQPPFNRQIKNLNQSFQCFEPKSDTSFNQNHLQDIITKQNKQNRLSVPINKQYQSYYQSRPNNAKKTNDKTVLQNSTNQNITTQGHKNESSKSSNFWQQSQSIGQMIELLVGYEKNCQQQMDLSSAEEARKKINQLKRQQLQTKRKQLQFQGKQYILKTRKQGREQLKQFNEFWQHKIEQALRALKQIEEKHVEQQAKDFQLYEGQLGEQETPRVKYSSKALQIRRNLSSLIKSRKYKQAQHLKSILEKKQLQEQQKWQVLAQQKITLRLKQFRKKQNIELEAFRIKLTSSFNELIKEKQKQQQRMSNKMKKKQVQSMKTPSSIARAKQNLLNQSKVNIQRNQY